MCLVCCYRPGPPGGDCSVADLTLQEDIVAQSGFWAPPDSDGSMFYKCPIPAACLPGVNGTRSQCATGYGSIVCRYLDDALFRHVSFVILACVVC